MIVADMVKLDSLLMHFFEDSESLACIINNEGEVVYTTKGWNTQMCTDDLSLRFTDVIQEPFVPLWKEYCQKLINGIRQDHNCFKCELKRIDGNTFPAEISASCVKHEAHEFIMCCVKDISFYKCTEENLLRDKVLLKEAQRMAKIGSWECDLKDCSLACSDDIYSVVGYKREELTDLIEEFKKIVYKDDLEKIKNIYAKILTDKKFYNYEVRIVNKEGAIIYLYVVGDLLLDNKGNPDRIYGVIQDISERKKYEEDLIKQQKLLTNSQRIAKMGTWELDIASRIAEWNDETYEIFGIDSSLEKPSHKAFYRRVHMDDKQKVKQHAFDVMKNHTFEDLECKMVLPDNSIKYVIVTGNFDFNEKGEAIRIYGIVCDVTDQHRQREQLVEAKEKAEQSDRLKSTFLANVSHEIRTPMNAIIGFSSFLKDDDLTREEYNKYADIIVSSGEHLLSLINDIVDISKIETGQVEIIKCNVNINHLLEELDVFFQSILVAQNKEHLNLEFRLMNEEVDVFTDEMRLRQVLINIIGNAVKYTDNGFVKVTCQRKGEFLLFNIQDTGIGIAEDKKELIFERFQQGNTSNEKLYGGTGLGLAIAKACVQLLEGEIFFDSQLGQGSIFTFTIKAS